MDKREYQAVHDWIRRKKGSADSCSNIACRKQSSLYEWALKRGYRHARKLDNYINLCSVCHKDYDVKKKKWVKDTYGIQIRVSPLAHKKLKVHAANKGLYITEVIDLLIKKL